MWTSEEYLEGNTLWVPNRLRDAGLQDGMRADKLDAVLLAYDLIEQRHVCVDSEWVGIADRLFKDRIPAAKTKTSAKKWLDHQGFIRIKKRESKSGQTLYDKIPKRKTQRYQACLLDADRVAHRLHRERNLFLPRTASDAFCLATRTNLDLLTADEPTLKDFLEEKEKAIPKAKQVACRHALQNLCHRGGTVKRGLRVNRLYSPWTNCPKLIRPIFRLAGEPLVELDLQASQPTLLGLLAGDDDFLRACRDDRVYTDISSLLEVDRDDAKRAFFRYLFGPIRTPKSTPENRAVCLPIQQWVEHNFPTLHGEVMRRKKDDHRLLNRALQNREAEIFLDGILADLIAARIPALTIHDAVYVQASRRDEAISIALRNLSPNLSNRGVLRVDEGVISNSITI